MTGGTTVFKLWRCKCVAATVGRGFSDGGILGLPNAPQENVLHWTSHCSSASVLTECHRWADASVSASANNHSGICQHVWHFPEDLLSRSHPTRPDRWHMTPGSRQTEEDRRTQSTGWVHATTSLVKRHSLSFIHLTVLKYSIPDAKKACATSLVVTTHDMGWPLPMGFPMVTMSGTKSSPCSWKAQKWAPTRPKPTWTSSAMTTPPALRTFLQRRVHSFTVAGRHTSTPLQLYYYDKYMWQSTK